MRQRYGNRNSKRMRQREGKREGDMKRKGNKENYWDWESVSASKWERRKCNRETETERKKGEKERIFLVREMQSAIKEEEEDLEVFSFYFETLVAAFFLFLLFSSQPSSKKRTKPSALNLNLSFVAKLVTCSSQTDRVFPVDQLCFCSASNLAFNFFSACRWKFRVSATISAEKYFLFQTEDRLGFESQRLWRCELRGKAETATVAETKMLEREKVE